MSECATCQDRGLVGGFLPAPCPECGLASAARHVAGLCSELINVRRERDQLRSELEAARREVENLSDVKARTEEVLSAAGVSPTNVDDMEAFIDERVRELARERDEWKQQHENAVASWRTDVANLGRALDESRVASGVREWAADVKMAAKWAQHAARVDAINLDLAAERLDFAQQVERLTTESDRLRALLREALGIADRRGYDTTDRDDERLAAIRKEAFGE